MVLCWWRIIRWHSLGFFISQMTSSKWLRTVQDWSFYVLVSMVFWTKTSGDRALCVTNFCTFWNTTIVFSECLFASVDTSISLSFVKLCGIQRDQTFSTAKWSCNMLRMLVDLIPKVRLISQCITGQYCIIRFCTASVFSDITIDRRRHPWLSSPIDWRLRLNSLY